MSTVKYQGGNGYLVGSGKIGLIIIHQWWGLTEPMKCLANEFANDQSFMVLAPDLYHGKSTEDALEAKHLMSSLDWTLALKELTQAKDFLMEKGCSKVSVTGFCMGGALTLAASNHIQGLSAAVCFYGIPENFKPETISCPIQMHFGKLDDVKGFSDIDSANKLYDAIVAAKKDVELWTYDAGHAFMNRDNAKYHKPSADIAFSRTVKFIREHSV